MFVIDFKHLKGKIINENFRENSDLKNPLLTFLQWKKQ